MRETAKFCPNCGQKPQQPQQPRPPSSPSSPTSPSSPNSQRSTLNSQLAAQAAQPPQPSTRAANRKPLYIAIAATLVVALTILLITTNIFGLIGNEDPNNPENTPTTNNPNAPTTSNSDINMNIPNDASEEELMAYGYIEAAIEFYEAALESEEAGLPQCANSMYAWAASSVCSMRYAVDCLLEMKGTPPPEEDEKLRDWNYIAALGWMSPFPYFFEGVVLEAKGDSAAAAECYRKAALNPNFMEGMEQYNTIKDLDENALNALKTALEELEDKIFEATDGPSFINIPRDENNFDVSYLRDKALECLEAEDEDLLGAFDYYKAALYANPFDGDNYANMAFTALFIDDGGLFLYYLNEGLLVDSDNVRLHYLQDIMKEVAGR